MSGCTNPSHCPSNLMVAEPQAFFVADEIISALSCSIWTVNSSSCWRHYSFCPVLSSSPLYGLINMMRDKKTVIFAYFYGSSLAITVTVSAKNDQSFPCLPDPRSH